MHKINVLILGPHNFNTSLEELKDYLNFNLDFKNNKSLNFEDYDVILIHEDCLNINNHKEDLSVEKNSIKILLSKTNETSPSFFHNKLLLPTTVKDINSLVENSVAKKNYGKNSSIKIKNYILDKNEKKLLKNNINISLTEKEIQLLELFLDQKTPINKEQILKIVWNYAKDADTHTVETHIYRLRKKIKEYFSDENFIENNKSGYFI
tara:strand:- start:1226 stop:1849 length:624 start_codon:yes stop_codon:yes gene_type:complete